MAEYSHVSLDAGGTEVSGRLDAADARQVAMELRRRGLFPMEILPVAGKVDAPAPAEVRPRGWGLARRLPFRPVVSPRERAAFTRQLGTLLRAGMPLLRGLEVLARQQANPAFREVITALAEALRTGAPLSEAMAAQGRCFDRLYVSMVRAGEAGGVLDGVLERLARFQEKSLQLRGKVAAALVYPLVVLGVAVAILAGLLTFVVPKFQQIFADLLKGAPLPALTQGVIALSELVRHHALGVVAGVVAVTVTLRALRGRRLVVGWLDAAVLRVPLFGDLFLKAVVARFARTLGTLLASGVPILPALLITRDTCGNARVAAVLAQTHDRVKAGEPVARPLADAALFPPMVPGLIEVGEHAGQLPEMLHKVADIYEDEVDNAVAGLSALIEPILILGLALVVGTIVIALFLPIIRIVQLLT